MPLDAEGGFVFDALRSFIGLQIGKSLGGRRLSCLRLPWLWDMIKGGEGDRPGLMMNIVLER